MVDAVAVVDEDVAFFEEAGLDAGEFFEFHVDPFIRYRAQNGRLVRPMMTPETQTMA